MECKTVHNILPDYVENKLDDSQHKKTAQHLTDCATCQEIYTQYCLIMESIESTQKVEADDFFYTRLKQKMDRQAKGTQINNYLNYKVISRSLAYAAVLIVGLLIGITTGSYINYEISQDDPVEEFAAFYQANQSYYELPEVFMQNNIEDE